MNVGRRGEAYAEDKPLTQSLHVVVVVHTEDHISQFSQQHRDPF